MMTEFGPSSRIYLDTNILIYLVESHPTFRPRVLEVILAAKQAGAEFAASDLVLAECLYGPSEANNAALAKVYQDVFSSGFITQIPITGDLMIRAAEAGGELGLPLADAIHYLAALEAGCDYVLTADARFPSSPQMQEVRI